MKRKLTTRLLGIMLALLMALHTPTQVLAATNGGEYISDVRICYGTPDKQALTKQGYKVLEKNLNETGDGQSVWLCYKTTTEKSEAITDLAVMNMKGGYSFDKYGSYLEEVIAKAEDLAADMIIAFNEFGELYQSDPESATVKATLKMMNMFYDDDTVNSAGKPGKLIGDMVKDGDLTAEVLKKIFYQGNLSYVSALEEALAVGLTELGEDTFLTRIGTIEYSEQLDATRNVERQKLLTCLEEARTYYKEAEAYGKAAAGYESMEAYLEQYSAAEKATVAEYVLTYEAASAYPFGNGILGPDGENALTLFEALTLPTQDEHDALVEEGQANPEDLFMDVYLADILLQALTPGQLALISTVPLKMLVNNGYSLNKEDADPEQLLNDALAELDNYESGSIYDGVDRTLFTHPKDVAMTYAAATNAKVDYAALGRKAAKMNNAAKVMGIIGGVSLVLFVISVAVSISLTNHVASESAKYGATLKITTGSMEFGGAIFSFALLAVSIISLIVCIILLCKKPDTTIPEVTYTTIPRAIVDSKEVNGEKQFYNYYCAKLVNAASGYDDYMNIYGDLNGKGGHSEWVCLYYTKDTRVGKPLTANFLLKNQPDSNLSTSTGYLPVHSFDSVGVENLNNYNNTLSGCTPIYLYVQQASGSLNASLFAESMKASDLIFFGAGAGLAFLATFFLTKRKREPETANA